MKAKILLTSVLLFGSVVAYAQDGDKGGRGCLFVGLSGGYAHNHLTTSVGYRPFMAYESRGGFTAGIPVVYRFADWFSLQTELSILQKNYKWLRTEYYVYDVMPYHEVKNTYLQLPLMARFSFGGKKLRGFCTPGVFIGYWAGSRIKGIALDNNHLPYAYDEPFEFDARRDNRFEYGLQMGLGLEYRYNQLFTFMLEGRYNYSLSDMQKDYMKQQTPRYNNTYVIQAGVLVNLLSLF